MKKTPSKESLFSNCSEVPTSETFSIGDVVKAGERTGRVAFVGRTQFQPGEWVGVVLETTDGKNNGTVNGIKYFECKDKRGLFCRPGKLVKQKHTPQSPTLSTRAAGGARSPTNSVYSVALSVAASQAGGTKEHSPYAAQFGFDLGERVVTADGKEGKLKFLGLVNDQVYAGIVFSRPVGDSDGTFQGVSYFKCYPKYACFMPADEVKRATAAVLPPRNVPRQTKASQLRLEKGGAIGSDAMGSGMVSAAFHGSRESLDSFRSPPTRPAVASRPNAIKDSEIVVSLKKCLQEKEAHLAQLSNELSERSSDADRLGQENKTLKLRVGELDAELSATRRDLTVAIHQLQRGVDERDKRLEDLSFCFTEMELKKEELELQLSELRAGALQPLIELEDEEQATTTERSDKGMLTPVVQEADTQTDAFQEQKQHLEEANDSSKDTGVLELNVSVKKLSQDDNMGRSSPLVDEEQATTTGRSDKATILQEASTQTDALQEQQQQLEEVKIPAQRPAWTQTDEQLLSVCEAGLHTNDSSKDIGVLELNVSKLSKDADSSLLNANMGMSSPLVDESLRSKYEEKCAEEKKLREAYEFQQVIIADQLNQIRQLKQQNADTSALNGNATFGRHPHGAVTVSAGSASCGSPRMLTGGGLATVAGRTRVATARTYCDYCELFDAHDTRECPKEEARQSERRIHAAISPIKRHEWTGTNKFD